MTDHERIEELLSARALGGLDREDAAALARERAAHGPDCAGCRRLETELDEVAGRLAFALDPVPVRAGAEETLMARALGVPAPAAAPEIVASDRRPEGRRGGWWRGLASVAAAALLLVGGYVLRDVTASDGATPATLAGARVVAFDGSQGTLSIAYQPGRAGVLIVGSHLPTPPERMVYEVWMIDGETKVPGPCLEPDADGSLFAYADAELGTTETMAVTVEPASCPSAPTSDPVFTADLTAA